MAKILILELRQSKEDLTVRSLSIVNEILQDNEIIADTISVDEPFSLLYSASISLELYDYDGMIILGCLLEDAASENKIIYKEILRCFSDLSLHYALPVGFGFLFAKDREESALLIAEKSKRAVLSCLDLIKLKNQFGLIDNEPFTRYSN